MRILEAVAAVMLLAVRVELFDHRSIADP